VSEARTLHSSGQQSIDALQWVGWADQDYIATRILLLTGQVVQGATLANTAIEKYLKAVCTVADIRFDGVGHDVSKLNGLLHFKDIRLDLRPDFLRCLTKAYKLRYPDELTPGFNVALNDIALLTETDLSVNCIRAGFVFRRGQDEMVGTKRDTMVKEHATELLTRNCALTNVQKDQLFATPSHSYDLRVLDNCAVIEAQYGVTRLTDDNNFRRSGLSPVEGSEGRSFKLGWPPQPGEGA